MPAICSDADVELLSQSKITHLTLPGTLTDGTCFASFIKPNKLQSLSLNRSPVLDSVFLLPSMKSEFKRHFKSSLVASYFTECQRTFSPAGWQSMCQLTTLTLLECSLVTKSASLNFSTLMNLTSLTFVLYEDFDDIERDPIWLSTLPLTLQTLTLSCRPKWQCDHAVYSTYRSYAQCLPHFTRLSKLTFLDLTLGGVITDTALEYFNPPSLTLLMFRFARDAEHTGIEESKLVADALSKIKSLQLLDIKQGSTISGQFKSLLVKALPSGASLQINGTWNRCG